MLAVTFYEDVKDELLRFAVVIAKHDGKWVFCKHKERETLEFPDSRYIFKICTDSRSR